MKLCRSELGFTLAELAVVLVIVGLLLGGLFVPLSAQTDIKYRGETDKALTDIREALIGYAIVNGRLPCPADRLIVTGNASAGVEATTGSGAGLTCQCTNTTSGIASATGGAACDEATPGSITGVLPWATLGLQETDAWGNRYTYRVNSTYSRGVNSSPSLTSTFGTGCTLTSVSDMPTKAAFALCTQGDITILTASSGGTTLASGIPAIAISHGKSPVGAWTTGGFQITGAATDELENADDDNSFVSSSSIDDQLVWVSPNLLMNRMISAGKLP